MTAIGKYTLSGDWEISNVGHTALAVFNDKKYFMKRYNSYRMPKNDPATISRKLYEKQKAAFEEFVAYRKEINEKLSEVAKSGGNIILPCEWFVADNAFIEVTDYIEDIVGDDRLFGLSAQDRILLLLTAAGALKGIHDAGIVHSDLKRSNILVKKNAYGKYLAKIIDFDKSYFVNRIRVNDLGGDQCYMSPELAYCLMSDLSESAVKRLSLKSDIFSLGIVFYSYLCGGRFPEIRTPSGDRIGNSQYCGEALVRGNTLAIGREIEEEYLRALIANMLYKDPAMRPDAQTVINVIKEKRVLSVRPDQGVAVIGARVETPRVEPARAAASARTDAPSDGGLEIDYESLRRAGFVKAESDRNGTSVRYKLFKRDGSFAYMSAQVLILTGYAKRR